MKIFPPDPIHPYAKLRNLKASALAVLTVIPTTIIIGTVYTTYGNLESQHPTSISDYFAGIAIISFWALIVSSFLMLIFGIPCYHAAKKMNLISLQMAIYAGIFPPLLLGSIVGILEESIWPICFLLPYGLSIAITFYHLIKQPTPRQ